MTPEHEERLDALFLEALDTNDPAMLDWAQIKMDLKKLRKIENDLICGRLIYIRRW